MKTNSLRIEPHRVIRHNLVRKDSIIFWRVWIDDKLEGETAFPFEKTDSHANVHYDIDYEWDDRNLYFAVRRVKNFVIWANSEIQRILFVFDWDKYQQICDAASTNIRNHSPKKDTLQETTSEEIQEYLLFNYPKHLDEIVIYRQPQDRYDTTGMMISRRIQKAITESTTFKICDTPAKTIELRIGLDMPEFIEAVWHVGRCEEGFAIYFEEYPYFPAWLYSESLSKVIEQEEFSKEL